MTKKPKCACLPKISVSYSYFILQLNQQSHSESEVKEDDDHETTGSMNASEVGGAYNEGKDAQKRKKKKKKKKCSSKAQNPRSSEDNFEASYIGILSIVLDL